MDVATPMSQNLERLLGLVRARRFDAAIEGLREFLVRYPDNEVATGLLASVYFETGLAAQAVSSYERVIELNPANALARFQLGMVRFAQGQPQAALDTWAVLTRDPNEFMASFHSALAYVQLGNTEQARKLLEAAGANMPVGHPLFPQLKTLRDRLSSHLQ